VPAAGLHHDLQTDLVADRAQCRGALECGARQREERSARTN
jgi:hypothetical protein